MAKLDITATALLAWDEYKDKPAEQALPSIYKRARDASGAFSGWYWKSIKTKCKTSVVVRSITFSLLILGTLLPILAGLMSDAEDKLRFTQIGVSSLALAGLLQIADRVFGWSSGWLRYITTATAMENLTRKFELDWAGYILGKAGHLVDTDIKPLFDLAAQLQESLMKLQNEETDKWVTEFNTGAALLGDIIKSQRESGEKAVEAAKAVLSAQKTVTEAAEKAKQSGAVEVILVHTAEPKQVSITIDEKDNEEFLGRVWSRLNILPGQHILGITTTEATPQTIKKVLEVPAGGVARIEVKL